MDLKNDRPEESTQTDYVFLLGIENSSGTP